MTTRKKSELLVEHRQPFFLSLDDHEIAVIKAFHRGEANADQQKAAFTCIVTKICKIGSMSFNSDPGVMAFNEGMRMVGNHLMHVASQPYDKLIKEE